MRKNVLVIGAGGVGQVVVHKCAQNNRMLGDIHVASRSVDKCRDIIASVHEKKALETTGALVAHVLNAMDVTATANLIRSTGAQIVINVGPSFVNMSVLSACLETGAAYIDTAIHEDPARICETPPWYANYEWPRRAACEQAGVTAILGAGFDPGVVNAYAKLAFDNYFDRVHSIDIVDINAGSHGRYFATNFDPEINFREFTGQVWSWQNSEWTSNKMFEVSRLWNLPIVGQHKAYLTGHDEVHSLSRVLGVPNVRFWMGFSDHYINVFTVLNNLGLLSEQPLRLANGQDVVPLKVVKAALPDPASLAADYTGKTCIGVQVQGERQGRPHEVFIYNTVDHQQAYAEVGSQGISYTAGVPAVAAAMLIATGEWDVRTMVNIEELPPQPFLTTLGKLGLLTRVVEHGIDAPLQSLSDR